MTVYTLKDELGSQLFLGALVLLLVIKVLSNALRLRFWLYTTTSFWCNTSVWQTDGETDIQIMATALLRVAWLTQCWRVVKNKLNHKQSTKVAIDYTFNLTDEK